MSQEELIKSAIGFLKNPKVVNEDKEKVKLFLRGKGLTDESIVEAYRRLTEVKPTIQAVAAVPTTQSSILPTQSFLPKPSHALKINLSHQGISVLPSLSHNLKVLVASFNTLASLPKEVYVLVDLEVLNLCNNKITDSGLPAELFALPSLKDINLSNNQLTSIDQFCRLTSLERLNLSENLIETIPDTISNLQDLQYLFLYRNVITSLPKSLLLLTSLKQIVPPI